MEKLILEQVKKAINESVITELTGYNKPLSNLIGRVIDDNSNDLYSLINDEFSILLNGDGFKSELRCALNQKLAKTLVARMGGELEKRVNELKQNPETRAKITLAISGIINDL